MTRLMPAVVSRLEHFTGGKFEVITVENDVFGPSVTTAGLLPGRAMLRAVEKRFDLNLILLPAESLNDDQRFIDDLPLDAMVRGAPGEIRCSYDFVDVLAADT